MLEYHINLNSNLISALLDLVKNLDPERVVSLFDLSLDMSIKDILPLLLLDMYKLVVSLGIDKWVYG